MNAGNVNPGQVSRNWTEPNPVGELVPRSHAFTNDDINIHSGVPTWRVTFEVENSNAGNIGAGVSGSTGTMASGTYVLGGTETYFSAIPAANTHWQVGAWLQATGSPLLPNPPGVIAGQTGTSLTRTINADTHIVLRFVPTRIINVVIGPTSPDDGADLTIPSPGTTEPVRNNPGEDSYVSFPTNPEDSDCPKVTAVITPPVGSYFYEPSPPPVTPPPGYIVVTVTVDSDGNLVVVLTPVADVIFDLNGGMVSSDPDTTLGPNNDGLNITGLITRQNRIQGAYIGTGFIPINDHIDNNTPQFGTPNNPNPPASNMRFIGWQEIVDGAAFGPVRPAYNTDEAVDPLGVAQLTITGSAPRFFRAVWEFSFIKTAMYDNQPNPGNPLPGAIFVLEQETETGWEYLYTTQPSGYCGIPGNVVLLGIDIDISATSPIRYRLTETMAPEEHIAPAGHWYIIIDVSNPADILISFQSEGGNPEFIPIPESQYMWYVGNNPILEWPFIKTDHSYNIHLSGAEFRLFVYNGDINVSEPEDVTSNNVGPADQGFMWSLAAVRTSEPGMTFSMMPGMIYRLVETVPPPDYQLPFGQWQIRVINADPTGPVLEILNMGSVPDIRYMDGIYHIANIPEFTLPLAGGPVSTKHYASGLLFLGSAILISFLAIAGKKGKQNQ